MMIEKIWENIEKMSLNVKDELTLLLKDKEEALSIVNNESKLIKVSVCIMTYNEERVIKRCIDSIYDFADEIIVFDTGSTDETKSIVKKFFPEINIRSVKFSGDFSKIRNEMALVAKNDWVFQIDADEYIGEGAATLIYRYIALLEHLNIVPKILSPILTNHDGTIIDNTRRIYKKDKELKYFGRVHEELRYKNVAKTEYLIIRLNYFHDGYQARIIEEKQKYKRNIELLNRMVSEEQNARWYYFLAREKIYAKEDLTEIKDVLDEGLKIAMKNGKEYLLGLLAFYFQIPSSFFDYKNIERYVKYCMSIFPDNMDCNFYNLCIETLKCQNILYSIAENHLDTIINFENVNFENGEGDNFFWMLGYIFFICNRMDLAVIMWKKISSSEYKSRLYLFRQNILAILEA